MEIDDKILKTIARNIGSAIEEIDEDEIQEAIRDAVDLEDIVKEVYKEDPDIRSKLKDKIKELILDDIDNISEISDIEMYLDTDNWEDLFKGIVDTDAMRTLIKEDPKIQRELEKKLKEILLEQLSDDELPGMENLFDEKIVVERVMVIMNDPNFHRDFIQALDERLKKIFMEQCRSSAKYDNIVSENSSIQAILSLQVNDIIQNAQFLNDIQEMFRNYISRMVGNSDFHKMIFNQMLTRLTEMLVERMFK